jgi:predicted NBD/HSP70 family sugar kinase
MSTPESAPHRDAPTPPSWPTLSEPESAAFRVILERGPVGRAEIARALGLSRASLTRVTRTLLERGLVMEGGVELRGWTGRPSELLQVRADALHLFGVKLTGDTAFAVVTDLAGTVVASDQEALGARAVDAVVGQITGIYDRFRAEHPDIVAAGVSIAGDIATVGGRELVIDSAFLGWDGVPLQDLLSTRLGIPVAVQNDVRALTAAEHLFGAGAGAASFALVTVGAGIGFGYTIAGEVVAGHTGHAGRVDHLSIDTSGPFCGLGHRGCASAYLPNDAIVRSLGEPGLGYEDAVERARAGDAAARRAFEDAGRALGTILGTVANFLDPERIVLTGDGLAVMELAEHHVHNALADARLPRGVATPLSVRPFQFSQWARAGAVTGMLALL